MARKEHKSTAKVIAGTLYHEDGACTVASSAWVNWLAEHTTFYYDSPVGTFTARREQRPGGHYWYAWRRLDGRLAKVYLGRSFELNHERLALAATTLEQRLARDN